MAERPRPSPPPRAGTPGIQEIPPGQWFRVHPLDIRTGRYPAHRFNDSGQGNARFSPLVSAEGLVPTLYAAQTLAGTLMETVLHDVPYPSAGYHHDLARDLNSDLHASSITLTKRLQVVDLTKLGLQRIGIRPSEMFETDAEDYPRTRAWAQWLHDVHPGAQGLMWLSARHPESRAIMLFGDRVRPETVRASEPADSRPLRDPQVLEVLLWLLDRLGCGVAPDR
jgi:hypothetical protein